jgi:hypothetical protein
MASETKPPHDSLLPILIVLALGVALMIGVIAITGPAGLFVVLAIGGVIGFAALHYVLWGWWLTRRLRDSDDKGRDVKSDD